MFEGMAAVAGWTAVAGAIAAAGGWETVVPREVAAAVVVGELRLLAGRDAGLLPPLLPSVGGGAVVGAAGVVELAMSVASVAFGTFVAAGAFFDLAEVC